MYYLFIQYIIFNHSISEEMSFYFCKSMFID